MVRDAGAERRAQDGFQSMVGETGPYPDDPQHPDPGFDMGAPAPSHDPSCPEQGGRAPAGT